MALDMETLKKLRDLTGAGIADCKEALEESGGDIDKAVEFLRKKGGLKAAKKADRATKEGVVFVAISPDKKKAAFVKLLCETDFVARNENFQKFAQDLAQAALEGKGEEFFNEHKDEMVLKVGENLSLGEIKVLEGEYIAYYLHSNKKVASGAVFNKVVPEEIGAGIAMQITAMSPAYLDPESVPQEEIGKEKEIYKEQLLKEGKPENIIDKILEGKINKYFEEVCLIKQPFIKDDKKSVEQALKEADSEAKIVKFVRVSL